MLTGLYFQVLRLRTRNVNAFGDNAKEVRQLGSMIFPVMLSLSIWHLHRPALSTNDTNTYVSTHFTFLSFEPSSVATKTFCSELQKRGQCRKLGFDL